MLELAQVGATSNPMLVKIDKARMVNSVLGGAAGMPWEIDDIPDEWLYAFEGITLRLPKMTAGLQKIEGFKAKWRASHPTYRKHIH